jgi:hypothetical protein
MSFLKGCMLPVMIQPLPLFAMMSARLIGGHWHECASLESCDCIPDGRVFGQESLNAHGLQLAQGAHANAPYDHAVDLLVGEGAERLAHSMTVVGVVVGNRPEVPGPGVHDHEKGRRTEMSAHRTLEAQIFGDRYT